MKNQLLSYPSGTILCLLIVLALSGCGKGSQFEITDPGTGLPPVELTTSTGDCRISKIMQKNKSTLSSDNAYEIKRDGALLPTAISFYDSLAHKPEYDIQLQTTGDTIRLSTVEYFVVNNVTKLVTWFSTRADLTDPASNTQLYQYVYDVKGYLSKKFQYINGSSAAFYETNYSYDNNNLLTGCIVYVGSKKDKLIQSTLDYDMTSAKKEWIYLFPDFFEAYKYLQAFDFGKRGTYPVKNITTKIFDTSDGSVLDTWATSFTGYVYSKDNFILQTTAQGDLQQGLGLLFGTTRFDYQCTK